MSSPPPEIVRPARRSTALVQNRCEDVGCVMLGRPGFAYFSFAFSSATTAAVSGKKPSLTTIS